MNKVVPNLGPTLNGLGCLILVIAIALYVMETPLWGGFFFFGGFLELLGWLILWDDY